MVAADPKYGYNVKPQNVIGVSTLLKDRKTGELTTARKYFNAQLIFQQADLFADPRLRGVETLSGS